MGFLVAVRVRVMGRVKVKVRIRVSARVRVSFSIIAVEGEQRYFWCITVLSSLKGAEQYSLCGLEASVL